MTLCSIIKRRDGTLAYCPIARAQKQEETDAEFLYACTRRVLMQELFNATVGTVRDKASMAAAAELVNAADKDGTLRAQCEALGVEVGGIIQDSGLPYGDKDDFRDAWVITSKRVENGVATCSITHDMAKARNLAREQIRNARAPRFAALDAEFIRAIEDNDMAKQNQIKAQKVLLRNATNDPRLDAAVDAQALKVARDTVIESMP